MDVNKQSQQAGEGSQLVQAGTIVINQGVSEERVRTVLNGSKSIGGVYKRSIRKSQ